MQVIIIQIKEMLSFHSLLEDGDERQVRMLLRLTTVKFLKQE